MMLWDVNVIVLWDDDDDEVNFDVYDKFYTDELSMMSDDMIMLWMICHGVEMSWIHDAYDYGGCSDQYCEFQIVPRKIGICGI